MTTTTAPTSATRPPYAAGVRFSETNFPAPGTPVVWGASVAGGYSLPTTLRGVVSSVDELRRDGVNIPADYRTYAPVHDGQGIVWVRPSRLVSA